MNTGAEEREAYKGGEEERGIRSDKRRGTLIFRAALIPSVPTGNERLRRRGNESLGSVEERHYTVAWICGQYGENRGRKQEEVRGRD